MRKVLEYQKLADDCRKRAAHAANQSAKEALQRLAATWDQLATTRHKQIEKGLVDPILEFGGMSIERDAAPPPRYLLTQIARRVDLPEKAQIVL